jgi:hypothetical protein
MVQIDPLLAYSFSAGLAVACRTRCEPRLADDAARAAAAARELARTVLWLGLAFAPQAVYLMWRFPAWETMYVFPDRAAIPPGLAAAVPLAIVAMGALGFWLTHRLWPTRRSLALGLFAASVVLPLLIVTVGWDGTGLSRMLFVGTHAQWLAGGEGSLSAFLGSDVARSLIWLQSLLLVPYAVLLIQLVRTPPAAASVALDRDGKDVPA